MTGIFDSPVPRPPLFQSIPYRPQALFTLHVEHSEVYQKLIDTLIGTHT